MKYYKQETSYTCGATSMRMALEQQGIKKSEKQLAKLLKTNKVRGTWTRNFSKAAERLKLKYLIGSKGKIEQLKNLQNQKYDIIVCYFINSENTDHYAVLKKIDNKYVHFLDPWFGPDHKYSLNYFKKIWKSYQKFEKEKGWFIAIKK